MSLHSTGKWFVSLGAARGNLAPPFALTGGRWLHALEIRFLLSEGALPPRIDKPFKRSKPGHVIESLPGQTLILNVLFGVSGTTHETPLPEEMNGAKLLQLTLRNGTCVVVIGRPMEMTEQHREQLRKLRYEFGIRLHSSTPPVPKRSSLELFQISGSPRGNIISVVPLGPEAFTTDQNPGKGSRWHRA